MFKSLFDWLFGAKPAPQAEVPYKVEAPLVQLEQVSEPTPVVEPTPEPTPQDTQTPQQ